MTEGEAATAIEDALEAQAAIYRAENPSIGTSYVLTSWVAVSMWAGSTDDGAEATAMITHLRGQQIPAWQIIGMLRTAQIQQEAEYLAS